MDKTLKDELQKIERQADYFLEDNCPIDGVIAMPPSIMMATYLSMQARDMTIIHFINRIEQVITAAKLDTGFAGEPFKEEFKLLNRVLSDKTALDEIWGDAQKEVFKTLNEKQPGWDHD